MRYYKIIKDDVLNGTGFRTTLVITRCQFNCVGCHAQHLKDPYAGEPFTDEVKEELFKELSKDYISGFSIFGGEITHEENIDDVTKLFKEIKEKFPNKTIWAWTGMRFDDVKNKEFIKYVDVLIDEPFVLSRRNLKCNYRGSDNQHIISVQESLKQGKIILAREYYEELEELS